VVKIINRLVVISQHNFDIAGVLEDEGWEIGY